MFGASCKGNAELLLAGVDWPPDLVDLATQFGEPKRWTLEVHATYTHFFPSISVPHLI